MLIKPIGLKANDVIGIFTASSPSYKDNEGLFLNGIKNLERAGFRVKEGSLTRKRATQGYRSGTPQERAAEYMEFIHDEEVRCLLATIGGSVSSSMIPYLDFDAIRASRKVICGFSDITSLHLAILKYAGLRTFYGPSLMCWHGDWPDGEADSLKWFLDAVLQGGAEQRVILAPPRWSNHRRRWDNGDWQNVPREWQTNPGWIVEQPGTVEASLVAFNLNTLLTSAGTGYWPELKGKILLIEDMDAPQLRNERSFRQLLFMGVFDQIAGLILGKPENFQSNDAPFSYEELLMEVVGERNYPIVSHFDCGHTLPMITIPQDIKVRLKAERGSPVELHFLEKAVDDHSSL